LLSAGLSKGRSLRLSKKTKNTQRSMKKLLVITAAGVMAASTLLAKEMPGQIQVGYEGTQYGIYQSGRGGEFTLLPMNPEGWLDLSGYVTGTTSDIGLEGTFQTFCLEGKEIIYPYGDTSNGYIYDAAINANAVQGGVGENGDPLSIGTSWLYSQFAKGELDGYNYGAGRANSAVALQNAIWWLEGEGPDGNAVAYDVNNTFMKAVADEYGEDGAKEDADPNEWGVWALNLTFNGQLRQDVLYYCPPSGDTPGVPDGGLTIFLLGLGLSSMAGLSRKFQK